MDDEGISVRGTLERPAGLMQFWRGDVQIAVTGLRFEGDAVHVNLNHLPGALDAAAELGVCVRAMHRRLAGADPARLLLFTQDPLVRDAARRVGMIGALRDPLVARLDAALEPAEPRGDPGAAVRGLGVHVETRPAPRGLRNLARASASGIRHVAELEVAAARGAAFRLTVPDADDLLVEQVARIADTAAVLADRFAPWWVVEAISVERSDRGLDRGHTAGQFDGGSGIRLAPNAVLADRLVADLRRRFDRSSRSFGPLAHFPSARHLSVEKTVAHEVGHQLWSVLERRHRDVQQSFDGSMADVLGVRRLADVLDGERPGAPPECAAAAARVRAEVSDYAMTNVKELVAELFGHWWTRDEPSPLLASFGHLVDEFLPPPASF